MERERTKNRVLAPDGQSLKYLFCADLDPTNIFFFFFLPVTGHSPHVKVVFPITAFVKKQIENVSL